MRGKNINKFTGLLITLLLCVALVQPVFAMPPEGAEVSDIYSSWAGDDVFYAQSVYGLGTEGTYSSFRGPLYSQKFAAMAESLEAVFESGYKTAHPAGQLTRGQVITALYGLLAGGDPSEADAIKYFVDNGLIVGRAQGDYQLDEICTVEEMIVFASRIYDHGVYGAGNYSVGFLWEAEGVSNKVYLLGSIHMSDASIYPLSKSAETAFARAENLVVEIDISALTEEDQMYIFEIGYMDPEGDATIADYLPEDVYELYVLIFEALGETPDVYDYFKPWLASQYLTSLMMAGGDSGEMAEQQSLGIDMFYLMRAHEAGKRVLPLETVQLQLDLFATMSNELQVRILTEILLTIADMGMAEEGAGEAVEGAEAGEAEVDEAEAFDITEFYGLMLNAFKTGDAAALSQMLSIESEGQDPELVEFNNSVFHQRDVGMTKKIAGYLEDDTYRGDYFIVVGAGHLVNQNSVVPQLIELGYTVERILK